jgi:hypothetical protein
MAVAEKGRQSGCPPTAHSVTFAIVRKLAYKANTHKRFLFDCLHCHPPVAALRLWVKQG